MINLGLITPWELLMTPHMDMVVTEFNEILFKANIKTFEFIQANFNEKIFLTDESSDEVKAGKKKLKSGSWRGKVTQ